MILNNRALNITIIGLSLLVCMVLSGCDAVSNQLRTDRSGDMEKQDYRDALAPRDIMEIDDDADEKGGIIPTMNPYISQGYTEYKEMPLVSVSVNRSVPLRDIFYQLAEQTGYDVELDPNIRGSIIFTARQRPLDQVISRICDMSGLRYKMRDNVLRVEIDTPYNKQYKLDYLSFVRTNSSEINTDISVVSGEGADTGSSFSSSVEIEVDFWSTLQVSLAQLLSNDSYSRLATRTDPSVEVVTENVPGGANAVINVGALPETEEEEEEDIDSEELFSINRQAGLINVYATEKTHKEVNKYLEELKRSITSQVLVEAKVLEVNLNDEFSAGIDWRLLDIANGNLAIDYVTSSGFQRLLDTDATNDAIDAAAPGADQGSQSPASALIAQYSGDEVQGLIRAISEYGTTKALASPRLVVLNNQSAVLNVARNRVFFIVEEEEEEEDDDTGDITTTYSYETRTVPEGVIINVMPSINLDSGMVSLAIRPSVTDIGNDTIRNPFVDVDTRIPQVSIQEIDTVLNVKSGHAVVIGGLMKDFTTSIEDGVPVLSDVPMLGSLFKSHYDQISKTELVIFLRVTILDESGKNSIHDTDRDLYRKFSQDRRPFKL